MLKLESFKSSSFIFFSCRWHNWFHVCLIPGWAWCAGCSGHGGSVWSWRAPRREGRCRRPRRQGRKGTLSLLHLNSCCWGTRAKQAAQGCLVFCWVFFFKTVPGRWSARVLRPLSTHFPLPPSTYAFLNSLIWQNSLLPWNFTQTDGVE